MIDGLIYTIGLPAAAAAAGSTSVGGLEGLFRTPDIQGAVFRGDFDLLCQGVPFARCCLSSYLTP